jgi:hypothetical protein
MWQVFCVRFFKNLDTCTKPNFDEIVWCYSEKADAPRQKLAQIKGKKLRFHEVVPELKNAQDKAPGNLGRFTKRSILSTRV